MTFVDRKYPCQSNKPLNELKHCTGTLISLNSLWELKHFLQNLQNIILVFVDATLSISKSWSLDANILLFLLILIFLSVFFFFCAEDSRLQTSRPLKRCTKKGQMYLFYVNSPAEEIYKDQEGTNIPICLHTGHLWFLNLHYVKLKEWCQRFLLSSVNK